MVHGGRKHVDPHAGSDRQYDLSTGAIPVGRRPIRALRDVADVLPPHATLKRRKRPMSASVFSGRDRQIRRKMGFPSSAPPRRTSVTSGRCLRNQASSGCAPRGTSVMPESPRRASYWAAATGTWLGDVKPSWCLSVRGETSGSAGACAVGGGKSSARLALDSRAQAPRRALLS